MDALDLVFALFIVLFVGGLSLLAHWARKNRGAEIGLVITLNVFSLVIVLLGALVALVGLSGAIPASVSPPELFVDSAVVTVLAGFIGLALSIPPLRKMIGHHRATAGCGAANPDPESFEIAGGSSGGWWSDPPIFFALWMFVVVLASNVVGLLAFVLTPDAVGSTLESAGGLSPVAIALNELPLLAIALFGVGLGVQRNFRGTLSRLGYGPVTLPQLGIVVLFVAGAILLQFAVDALFAALQPALYVQVGKVSEGLLNPNGLGPVSAILFALFAGAGAGLGEETLFRGAVQPALGIPLASILFASIHVQYGPSIILIYLFVLSVGLGLLRKRVNTTASFLAHAGYDSTLMLLAYFFSL